MTTTVALKPAGPTSVVSVTGSSSTAITVSPSTTELSNLAAFWNSSASVTVAINITPSAVTAGAAVLPTAGSPTNTFVLPPAATNPLILEVPSGGFSVTLIGSAAGPSLVYVTPLASM